jgi:hypothetical protein
LISPAIQIYYFIINADIPADGALFPYAVPYQVKKLLSWAIQEMRKSSFSRTTYPQDVGRQGVSALPQIRNCVGRIRNGNVCITRSGIWDTKT